MGYKSCKTFLPVLLLLLTGSPAGYAQTGPGEHWTETEKKVFKLINQDGIKVVHFWATWCHNSKNELERGIWPRLVETNPGVEFIFVTIRDNGKSGLEMLEEYGIPKRVMKMAQPKVAPNSDPKSRVFMDLPSFWTPTTWIFNEKGQLAYAFNYGEVDEKVFQNVLNDVQKDWSH